METFLSFSFLGLRISPDQQATRFQSRAKRVIQDTMSSIKALPDDKLPIPVLMGQAVAPVAAGSSVPESCQGSGPGGDETGTNAPMEWDDQDDDLDAQLLGLPDKKRKKGEQNASKIKAKRSKAEILQEDCEKIEQDVANLVQALPQWPAKPNGYDLGRVDRAITTKLKVMRDASAFDNVQKLELVQKQLGAMRNCMTTAQKYLPNKGLPAKKHLSPFYDAFLEAESSFPNIVQSFPEVVQQHFMEAAVVKDVEAKDWSKVAGYMAKDKLEKIYGDAESADKQAVSILEKTLSVVMGSDVDEAAKLLASAGEAIMLANPPEIIKTNLPLLMQLGSLDPQGASTLDGLINMLHEQASQPIIRVVMDSAAGKDLVGRAEDRNSQMQERASKLTTMIAMKDLVIFVVIAVGLGLS